MKEKILFLTAFVPNDSAAAEKNTKLMLKDLSASYNVDLIYFKYKAELEYVPDNDNIKILKIENNSLKTKIYNILMLPIIHPIFSVRFNRNLLGFIRKKCQNENYKAIICDHSQMFLYARYLSYSIPKILLSHDVIAQRVSRSSNSLIKWICMKSEKYSMTSTNSHVFSFSQKDCNLINELYNIPAHLCLDYIDEKILEAKTTVVTNNMVFIGKWSRKDNLQGVLWFFSEVVPLINREVNIVVIGKNFPKEKINNINENIKISFLGFVDNPYPIIANCKALLSPLFTGAGIKVKVIEALACGAPVIGTDIAFEGFNLKYSKFMLRANDSSSFAYFVNNVDFPIEERLRMKSLFISDYCSETIPGYLKKM